MWGAAPSAGAATELGGGTHWVPGKWAARKGTEPRIRRGTSRVADGGVAAGSAGGAGAGW